MYVFFPLPVFLSWVTSCSLLPADLYAVHALVEQGKKLNKPNNTTKELKEGKQGWKEDQETPETQKEKKNKKEGFVDMLKTFDTRPPDQLSDHWKKVISDAVRKIPLPANITQEMAFNPSQAEHNKRLSCMRVQQVNGQLYVYLGRHTTLQAWYSLPAPHP